MIFIWANNAANVAKPFLPNAGLKRPRDMLKKEDGPKAGKRLIAYRKSKAWPYRAPQAIFLRQKRPRVMDPDGGGGEKEWQ